MVLNMLFCGNMWVNYAEKKLYLYFKKAASELVASCGVIVR